MHTLSLRERHKIHTDSLKYLCTIYRLKYLLLQGFGVIYVHTKTKEEHPMTEKQLKQAKSQLPQGEKLDRCYSAF